MSVEGGMNASANLERDSQRHTLERHTHTHTQRERERKKEKEREREIRVAAVALTAVSRGTAPGGEGHHALLIAHPAHRPDESNNTVRY
jgi:hypothetical protein